MDNERYEGWRNYATWRVKLEWFDNAIDDSLLETIQESDVQDVAEMCKQEVLGSIEMSFANIPESCRTEVLDMAEGYVYAFIDDVDWYEIAEEIKHNAVEEHTLTKEGKHE